MLSPSLTIESVHGIKETILFSNFTVGPQTPVSMQYEERPHEETASRPETTKVSVLKR